MSKCGQEAVESVSPQGQCCAKQLSSRRLVVDSVKLMITWYLVCSERGTIQASGSAQYLRTLGSFACSRQRSNYSSMHTFRHHWSMVVSWSGHSAGRRPSLCYERRAPTIRSATTNVNASLGLSHIQGAAKKVDP